jgi:hypothetical protein
MLHSGSNRKKKRVEGKEKKLEIQQGNNDFSNDIWLPANSETKFF